MRWKLYTVFAMLAVLGLSLCMVFWLARQVPSTVETLTIAESRQIMSALLYIAQVERYFASEGLAVSIQPAVSGKASLAAVIEDKADIAAVAEVPFMRAVLEGQPVQVFSTIQTTDKELAVIARTDAGISTPTDLAGKRLGIIPGTASDYFLNLFLAMHNLKPSSLVVVPFEPAEAVAALVAGKVDAASLWTTLRLQVQDQLPDSTISFSPDGLYTETWNLASRKAFLHKRSVATHRLLRGLLKAEHFARTNRQQAVDIVALGLHLDRRKVEELWDNYGFVIRLDQALLVNLEGHARTIRHASPSVAMPNFLQSLAISALSAVAPQRLTVPR